MFALTLHTYSGMLVPINDGDRDDVRRSAARRIRRARRAGQPVTTIARGLEWELQERDDAALVGDCSGLLHVQNVGAECSECGTICDDVDRRRLSASARRYLTCNDCANDRYGRDDDND